MKRTKKIIAGLLTIALIFGITLGVSKAASAPSSITVQRAIVLNDIVGNKDHGFTIFTTSDGKYIYCMDVDKKALSSGQKATLVGNGDAGLLYILQNGYPNKAITGNENVDKYITQGAVWWYLDESKLSSDWKNATTTDIYGAIPKIKALVAAARGASEQPNPSMTVTVNDSSLSLTSDKKYYESDYMYATLTGASSYTVKVAGGTKNTVLVNEAGTGKTTFNSKEKFKVRIPASEVSSKLNLSISFAASGTVQKAKIYKTSDSAYQRVTGLYDETVDLSKSVNLSVTPEKKVCEYTDGKYYGKDGKEVDKTTYNKECNLCSYKDGKYHGKDGREVDEKTYNKECKNVCEYVDGKYYGKNGNVVDETTYSKECNPSCEYVDGKYYGKDGKVVGKNTYEKQCGTTHICEYTDDNYYGATGAIVDKDTFDRECGTEVVVPNTKSDVSPLGITLGIVMLSSGAYVIVSRRMLLS